MKQGQLFGVVLDSNEYYYEKNRPTRRSSRRCLWPGVYVGMFFGGGSSILNLVRHSRQRG